MAEMTEKGMGMNKDTGKEKSLQGGPGTTTISDSVVAKIAGIAARQINGVHELGGATQRAISGVVSRVTGGSGAEKSAGVSVEVGQEETIVDIGMTVDYGQDIPELVNSVRENVMNQIHSLTGLRVKEVNITVNDLYFANEERQRQQKEREERVA